MKIFTKLKKINNNGQAHLVSIYKTYIQTQSTDIPTTSFQQYIFRTIYT